MSSFLSRFFGGRNSAESTQNSESFPARFHRFKSFLGASMDGYSAMLAFEERLASVSPVGMPFLRSVTARLGIAVMQCIMQLQALGGERFSRLNPPFSTLRGKVQEAFTIGLAPLEGPLVVPYSAITDEHKDIIAPNLLKLEVIEKHLPEYMPQGFVITGVAWWQFVQDPILHDEIDRLMLVSQDDPNSYSAAAMAIREKIASSFGLSKELKEEIEKAVAPLQAELQKPGNSLLIRCIPVRHEHSLLVLPEQVINTPVRDMGSLYSGVVRAFSLPYRTRAMIYRLKLGIRDRGMPFCLSFTLFSSEQARGSVHRHLDIQRSDELQVRIRRNYLTPEGVPMLEAANLPEGVLAELEEKCRKTLACLSDAPVAGNRHEVYWMAGLQGQFSILGAQALPDADYETIDTMVPAMPEQSPCTVCLKGGKSTYPGIAYGKVFVVRNFQDALQFPIGSILLVEQAAPKWAFLLDFASGAIAADGTGAGPFAQAARRYGRPTVLGMPEVFDSALENKIVLMLSNMRSDSAVCACPSADAAAPAAGGQECGICTPAALDEVRTLCERAQEYMKRLDRGHNQEIDNLWLSDSDIANISRALAPLVARQTLPDSETPEFRADNCKTFHDFLVFCNDHVVREMFRIGTSTKSSQAPAKQLVCDVPKQFWMINLSDGFTGEVNGPVVKLSEIASIPMLSLWEGFSAKPWEGPPQLNAKGFLSVVFEATRNPNIDPAAAGSHYTEKNIFLISKHFCSMRCRFGFHFLTLDCFLSERPRERFLVFQFKGGAANMSRRVRRVHFVAELLAQFECSAEIMGDTLTARMEGGDVPEMLKLLRVIGYLVMHTRQLDMIMGDEAALAVKRAEMLGDMTALAEGQPLPAPEAAK